MTGAAKIPTGATRLDVMIGALENDIAALRKQNDTLVAALVGMITAYELGNEDQLRTEVTDASAALEAAE